jgi:RHS repeat-associated protein
MNLAYNGATNRIATPGHAYDGNGNLTTMPYLSMSYDVQNRLIQTDHTTNGTTQYGYSPGGQRVWKRDPNWEYGWSIDYYGVDGKLMSNCWAGFQEPATFTSSCDTERLYFGGKHVRTQKAPRETDYWGVVIDWAVPVTVDRLGSAGNYYPYGEARTNGASEFATYQRDNTGLDYAQNRYYSPQIARFTTADPYQASGGPAAPQSWNRYAYVQNDPINFGDPTGLWRACPNLDCTQSSSEPPSGSSHGGAFGGGDGMFVPVEVNTEFGQAGGGTSGMSYLDILRQTLLAPAVAGAVERLVEPDCAAMFGLFGGLDAASLLQSAFDQGNVRFYEFGSNIPVGVAAQTATPYIQIGINRAFVTGLVPGPTGATTYGSRGNPSVGVPIQGFISITNPPPGVITGFQGMSMDEMRQAVLIHELLHLLGVVGPDNMRQRITLPNGQTVYGSSGVTAAVRQNCFH